MRLARECAAEGESHHPGTSISAVDLSYPIHTVTRVVIMATCTQATDLSTNTRVSYSFQPTVVLMPDGHGSFTLDARVTANGHFCDDQGVGPQLSVAHDIVASATSLRVNWLVDEQRRMEQVASDIRGMIQSNEEWRTATVRTFTDYATFCYKYQREIGDRASAIATEEARAEAVRRQGDRRQATTAQAATAEPSTNDSESVAAHPRHRPSERQIPFRQSSLHDTLSPYDVASSGETVLGGSNGPLLL